MRQLAIDLSHRTSFGRADFLMSGCNAAALGWIERWPAWPGKGLLLHGPAQSGKTHLGRLWCERAGGTLIGGDAVAGADPAMLAAAGAVAVDDAQSAPERALLHLHNCCNEAGCGLLLTARDPPGVWNIALPDLASRLRAMPAVGIAAPDDALLAAVLVKHFADRQLRVAPDVIEYAVRRMERSFAAAAGLAAALDRAALDAGRPIGIALARRVLAEAVSQPAPDLGVT